MTNPERDELLIRIDERLDTISRKLDRDGNALYGTDANPGTGLVQRVTTIETGAKWGLALAGVTGAIISLIVNVAVAMWRK